jgi:hypothetical protein
MCVLINGGAVLGILGLIATVGLWLLKRRWSVWSTIVVSVLNIVSSAPGIGFAASAVLRVGAFPYVIGSALIALLMVLPNSRRAYT